MKTSAEYMEKAEHYLVVAEKAVADGDLAGARCAAVIAAVASGLAGTMNLNDMKNDRIQLVNDIMADLAGASIAKTASEEGVSDA